MSTRQQELAAAFEAADKLCSAEILHKRLGYDLPLKVRESIAVILKGYIEIFAEKGLPMLEVLAKAWLATAADLLDIVEDANNK